MTPQNVSFRELAQLETDIGNTKSKLSELETKLNDKLNRMLATLQPGKIKPVQAVKNGAHKATKRTVRKAVPVKFRDPGNPENTWTGRGRQPRWITQSGKSADSFRLQA